MFRPGTWFKTTLAASLVALSCAVPVQAQQATLSPAEMRNLASQAALQGQSQLAYDLSSALIARDASDINAQLIRSRAARNLGRNDQALADARAAWALADEDRERYAAALAQAQALSSAGRRTAAQLWLRRAAQVAPNEQAKAAAARDFRYVRGQNPWAHYLSFSVSPSSNINNGSKNETSQLFDLPIEFALQGASRALSGVELSAGISSRYRLRQSKRVRTDALFRLNHRTYVLSDDAKDIAPDAEGSDFASTTLSMGLQETRLLANGRTQFGWDVAVGNNWYGGETLFRFGRLGANLRHMISPKAYVSTGFSVEAQDGQGDRADADVWTGRLGYARVLGNGDRLSLGLSYSQSESDADFLDYTRRAITARYSLAKPVGPVGLEFGVTLSDKTHDRSSYSSDGRQEDSIDASVTMVFNDLDYYGFVPTMTLRAQKTDANINLYESEEFGIQMGIRSAF